MYVSNELLIRTSSTRGMVGVLGFGIYSRDFPHKKTGTSCRKNPWSSCGTSKKNSHSFPQMISISINFLILTSTLPEINGDPKVEKKKKNTRFFCWSYTFVGPAYRPTMSWKCEVKFHPTGWPMATWQHWWRRVENMRISSQKAKSAYFFVSVFQVPFVISQGFVFWSISSDRKSVV